ncbi:MULTISPECIES: H-NS family nucleoid-associated regulatory protein [Paraburkholderia]|uniref:H-NS histone family protein n=1 Tax=Paraburkholderia podalyriae TaxID=1938811 RepID=A0ABR7PQQ5_9BURK|nr:H-NS family nucleoid-associated regulatory protein [Paraburkholderia podalyriae]MBC8748601.1 H-NS histone family protein [Paraburkholderia podalyriae]
MTPLESLQAKIQKLQNQADALIAKKSSAVIEKIRELMSTHGLTTADLDAHVGDKKRGPKAAAKSAVIAKPSAAKYQDPKTGATWSGHGRAPGWIANAKDRSKFLIEGGADAVVAAGVASAKKAKPAGKKVSSSVSAAPGTGQPKGPQPAKYRDAKSGATWSGRGPAPAWLSGAKDRAKSLIDGAGADAAKPVTSKPKAGFKTPAAKKVVGNKISAEKKVVVPKKAVATKSPASKKVAAKKAVASPTKRPVVTKVAAKKTVAVKVVAANADSSAVPKASVELSA